MCRSDMSHATMHQTMEQCFKSLHTVTISRPEHHLMSSIIKSGMYLGHWQLILNCFVQKSCAYHQLGHSSSHIYLQQVQILFWKSWGWHSPWGCGYRWLGWDWYHLSHLCQGRCLNLLLPFLSYVLSRHALRQNTSSSSRPFKSAWVYTLANCC